MDEDFLDVTESGKKVWLIFILIIVTLAILGYLFIFKKFNFSPKTVQVELGGTISTNVEDYLSQNITNPDDYKLDLKNANANEIGTYNYTITYNKITKSGKIEVKDTTPPEFELQEFVVEEGAEEYFLGDFLLKCEDLSTPCLVSLKNDKDEEKFNKVGSHEIEINVADLYGNKKTAKANLKVVEKGTYVDPKSTDLTVTSSSKENLNLQEITKIMLEKGYSQESDEASDILNEVSSIDFENYVKINYPGFNLVSSDIIELFNQYSYIIGHAVELKISDGKSELVVYVDKTKVPASNPSNEEETN